MSHDQIFKLGVIQEIYRDDPGDKKQLSGKFPTGDLWAIWSVGIHRMMIRLYLEPQAAREMTISNNRMLCRRHSKRNKLSPPQVAARLTRAGANIHSLVPCLCENNQRVEGPEAGFPEIFQTPAAKRAGLKYFTD
jgi:hypothetical protein